MPTAEAVAPIDLPAELQRAAALLGGPRVLKHQVADPLDAHKLILRGMPARALTHLIGALQLIQPSTSLEKAIGMSLRTFQRNKAAQSKALSPEHGSRTWKFAEVLAKATGVLGSQHEAERWLEQPAIGLDQMRPIDLLATSVGTELVEQYLGRLAYDVYT